MKPPYKYIDPAVLLEAASQDMETFLELSATFLEIAPPMFERLQTAIRIHDIPAVTLESHSLKSTVALVGAVEVADAFGRIEALSRNSALQEIRTLQGQLAELYAATEHEVRSSIEHFRNQTGSADGATTGN